MTTKLQPVEPFTPPLGLLQHVPRELRDTFLRAVIHMAFNGSLAADIAPFVRGFFEGLTVRKDFAMTPADRSTSTRFEVHHDPFAATVTNNLTGWFVVENTAGEARRLAGICEPFRGESWADSIAAALNSKNV
jgi:hypothetical protein